MKRMPFSRSASAADVCLDSLRSRGGFSGGGVGVANGEDRFLGAAAMGLDSFAAAFFLFCGRSAGFVRACAPTPLPAPEREPFFPGADLTLAEFRDPLLCKRTPRSGLADRFLRAKALDIPTP